jgi:hypothetical protein
MQSCKTNLVGQKYLLHRRIYLRLKHRLFMLKFKWDLVLCYVLLENRVIVILILFILDCCYITINIYAKV